MPGHILELTLEVILKFTLEVILEFTLNSLTPKSVPTGTKLVLFGRYVLNIYIGIV